MQHLTSRDVSICPKNNDDLFSLKSTKVAREIFHESAAALDHERRDDALRTALWRWPVRVMYFAFGARSGHQRNYFAFEKINSLRQQRRIFFRRLCTHRVNIAKIVL